jgi:hypothetical protein
MDCLYDGVCGLYCGACRAMLAVKNGSVDALAKEWDMAPGDLVCHGCKSDTNAAFCRDCDFKECAASRGVEHCFECDDFPCETLAGFRSDEAPHHSVVLSNSDRMREVGVARWLEEQKLRWSCPSCNTAFAWYDKTCKACGAALRDCKAEEAEL